MGDPVSLPDLIKYVGVVVSVVGILIATPSGTFFMWNRGQTWTRQRAASVKKLAAWMLRGRDTHANIRQSSTVLGSAALSGSGTATASGEAWPSSGSAEERIERLHDFVTVLQRGEAELRRALQEETSGRHEDIKATNKALHGAVSDLRKLIARNEQDAAHIDGRGLPVLALGILLTNLTEIFGAGLAVACATTLASFTYMTCEAWRSIKLGKNKAVTT